MSDRVHGHIVICGEGEMYFQMAADAKRYAEFMAELGYDALYFDAQIQDDGTLLRLGRETEQDIWACIVLDL